MLLTIAWRNVLANKKKTILTLLLLVFSTALFIFFTGITEGSHRKMIKDAVKIYTGYLQIQGKSFKKYSDYEHLIYNTKPIISILEKNKDIIIFASRFETFALFSTEDSSVGVMFTGIEPEKEKEISIINDSIIRGQFLTDSNSPEIIIGDDLSKRLNIDVGSRVAYVSTAVDYSMSADYVTVVGLFHTGLFEIDNSAVFVSKQYMDELFLTENIATQIVILPVDTQNMAELVSSIKLQIDSSIFDVLSWRELLTELVQAVEVDSVFGYITMAIFFIVIFFVIMLYSLIAIMLRTREIGVMKAIGTTSRQIWTILIYESFITGFIGTFIGGIIGSFLAWYFQENPIMLNGYQDAYKDLGIIVNSIPSVFSIKLVLINCFIVFLLGLLSVVYPAIKVNSYRAIDALTSIR